MSISKDIIFEPAYTPNKNWVKELDPRHMDSTLSSFFRFLCREGYLPNNIVKTVPAPKMGNKLPSFLA